MSTALTYRIVPDRSPTGLSRVAYALRSFWRGPMTNQQLAGYFTEGSSTTSGVAVSESSALTYSAVFAAINLISSDVGSLPLHFFKRLPNGGKEKYTAHPVYRLLHDQPNPEQSSVSFRRTLQAHALAYGNGYAQIIRNGGGQPVELWPLTPDRVTPFRQTPDAPLQYRVANESGSGVTIFDVESILHIAGLGHDGTLGYSVIRQARDAIGLGMAADQFGSSFFANGATFGGVIAYPGAKPNELAEKNYRENLNSQHQGVAKAHRFLMLYGGAKYERIGIPPDDAQFLETRQFQISEIARFFNVPPHKIGDLSRSTNNNIEQQSVDYYTTTLIPWLATWEQELSNKLVASLERNLQFAQHNVDGILRGDSASRGAFYREQFNVASITPNEIREFENRNPVPGGERSFVALNLIPLDKVDAWYDAQIDKTKADAEKARMPPPEPKPAAPAADPAAPALQRELDRVTAERDAAIEQTAAAVDRTLVQAAEWATREGERVAQLAERAELIGRLTQHVEALTQRSAEIEAERVGWQTRAVESAGTVETLTAAQAAAEAGYLTATDAHAQLTAQLTEARAALAVAQQDTEAARSDAAHVAEVLAVARAEVAEATALTARLESTLETGDADRRQLTDQLTALTARAEAADAVIIELRAHLVTVAADCATAVTVGTAAREELAQAITTRDETARALGDVKQALRLQTNADDERRGQLRDTRAAIRDVLTRAAAYVVDRESDRARRAQGTPEKLRKWATDFYPMQEDLCRDTLRPALRAWLVATGQPLLAMESILDEAVPAHLEAGLRQLHQLATDHDPETLAPALERVLRRWETERVNALVDRLTRVRIEGDNHD